MSDPSSPSTEFTQPDDEAEETGARKSETRSAGPPEDSEFPAQGSWSGQFTSMLDRTVGQYELLQLLGHGGMGAVYKARHKSLDKLVALKLLTSDFMRTEQSVARFKREMKAVGKITHPNIVQAHDAGEIEGTYYLAMELVEGTDLYKLVKEHGRLSVPHACEAIRQAALGLAAAHKEGLVHRDIKPSNLLLAKSDQIKILDLGLARFGTDGTPHEPITSSGQVLGTPDYMAPEQWEDTHTADLRTDLYALGCTLFYLLTGRAPYATDEYKSVVKKMYAHVHAPIPDLKAMRSDVPDGVAAIYSRLMLKHPEDRYDSAMDLVNAIAPFATAIPVELLPVPPAPKLYPQSELTSDLHVAIRNRDSNMTTVAHVLPSGAPIRTGASGARQPSRTLFAGLAIAALVVLLGIAFSFNRSGSKNGAIAPSTNSGTGAEESLTTKSAVRLPDWPADAPKPAIAPFNAEQARKHQEEWARYLSVPVEYENSIGMKFHLIPPGEFFMGITQEYFKKTDADLAKHGANEERFHQLLKTEVPQHKVRLTNPVYLGIHEVTQQDYETIMGTNPSYFSAMGQFKDQVKDLDTRQFPIDGISWNNAAEFCTKLSEKEGRTSAYLLDDMTMMPVTGTGYRLPTEAEWEFSCRAGTTTEFWTGDSHNDVETAGWWIHNSEGRTHPVGQLKANPFGLYDVHGNVFEFTQDGFDLGIYQKDATASPAIDPIGALPAGFDRAFRGGNWRDAPYFGRSSARLAIGAHETTSVGFRVVLPVVSNKSVRSNK